MELPNNLHLCIPQEGFIHTYIDLMQEYAPGGDAVINIGLMIPLALYELNRRGYRLDLQAVGEKPRALSIASVVVAQSGLGKSTAWQQLLGLYEEVTGHPHPAIVSAEGTVAGMIENLGRVYDKNRDETVGVLHSDEFSSVLVGIASNRHNVTLPQFFNTIFSGGTYTKSMKGQRSEAGSNLQEVRSPRLTGVFLTVAEALERTFTNDMANTGFLARMLLLQAAEVKSIVPLRKRFLRIPPERWAVLVMEMRQWLNALDLWAGRGTNMITVEDSANLAFDNFTEALGQKFDEAELAQRTVMARAEWKAHVIAALYATTRGSLKITEADAQAASNLALESCDVVSRLAGLAIGGSETDLRLERAMRALRHAGAVGVKRAGLYAPRTGRVATTEREMTEVISTLEDRQLIFGMADNIGKPGRPSMRYWAKEFAPQHVVDQLQAVADYSEARRRPN
jgi:hypothetical protein